MRALRRVYEVMGAAVPAWSPVKRRPPLPPRPAKKAFEGFSSSVIIIIASVLVISRAVAVSGIVDSAMRRLLRLLDSTTLQVGALTAAVTLMSAFVKNVGALGVFMPHLLHLP